MDKEKVEKLIKRIDKALRDLAKATDVKHISAYIINGGVSIDDYDDLDKPKFEYYKKGDLEDIEVYE